MTKLSDIQEKATALKSSYGSRDEMYTAVEEMYFMRSPDLEQQARRMDNAKLTISPDARDTLNGAVRLLIASDPIFSIPHEEDQEQPINLEKLMAKIYSAASKQQGNPPHYDAVLSGMLYSDVDIAITNTADYLAAAEGKSEAHKARARLASRRTPFLFEVRNPRYCYPKWDNLGLVEHYREVDLPLSQVRSTYGDGPGTTGRAQDSVTLCEWWDLENHAVWINGQGTELLNEPHGLPFIPIVAVVAEGSTTLFTDVTYQRQPFLYGVWKSGLWKRQNLSLTVLYTMIFAMGANPMYIYQTNQPGKELAIDYSRPGGSVTIEQGESYQPLIRQVIDPSIMTGLDIAERKAEEATMYKVTMGQSIGSQAAYSTVALLSQSGRLPLVSPQKKLSYALGQAMEIAMRWLRYDGKKRTVQGIEVLPKDIPEDIEVECTLEANLPQDKLQQANIAKMLTEGDNPLLPKGMVVEDILKMGESKDIQKAIWREKASSLFFDLYAQNTMQQAQMATQAQAAQMQPQQPAQPEQPGVEGGLPPQQLQAGMQGPEQMGGEYAAEIGQEPEGYPAEY